MSNDYFKYNELKSYFYDAIKDHDEEWVERHYDDLHYYVFDRVDYIIGYYKCEKWLGDQAFYALRIIKEYEEMHFDQVTTDLSDSEKVVNMYTSIVGQHVVNDWKAINEQKGAAQ